MSISASAAFSHPLAMAKMHASSENAPTRVDDVMTPPKRVDDKVIRFTRQKSASTSTSYCLGVIPQMNFAKLRATQVATLASRGKSTLWRHANKRGHSPRRDGTTSLRRLCFWQVACN